MKLYSRFVVAAYAGVMALVFWMSPGLVDPLGKPFGYDFITFWSAGALTLDGQAAAAFDKAAIFAAQRVAVPGSNTVFLWHYPPTFQLVAAGLALLPYLWSYFAFTGLSLAIYVAVLRQIVPWREAGLLLLAFPGVFIAATHGQNSLLSASLICGALLLIDRRPIVSGICIGLMAYKPQLAVLFPLVLMVTGRWRVFWSAAVTALGFAGLATVVLGVELWSVFLSNARVVSHVLEVGQLPWAKMPSAYTLFVLLGAPSTVSYVVQVLVAVTVTSVTALVWWRTGPTLLAGAVLVSATLMIPPYIYDYELALLAIPLALLAGDMLKRGASPLEKFMLPVLYMAPIGMVPIAELTHIQVGFFIVAAIFVWSVQRALADAAERKADPFDWLPGKLFAALR